MKTLSEQLDHLDRAVPDAPELVGLVMRGLPKLPVQPRPRFWTRTRVTIGAAAASILIGGLALIALIVAPTPRPTFGQVVDRVSQFNSVKYCDHPQHDPSTKPSDIWAYHRTLSSDARERTDYHDGSCNIHNAKTSPEVDLNLDPQKKIAEFILIDADREALFGGDNPVAYMLKFVKQAVTSAPDEVYKGKPVHVFVGKTDSYGLRVFVDKDTNLPQYIELSNPQGIIYAIQDDFEWNAPVDDSIYSMQPPKGYKVVYNLIKPLYHGLAKYAQFFDGHLPDQVNPAALELLRQRVKDRQADKGELYDADWGFAVPAFAAAHKIDFRYYGKGQVFTSFVVNRPGKIIAAIETAPGSGIYDVFLNDFTWDYLPRSKLP